MACIEALTNLLVPLPLHLCVGLSRRLGIPLDRLELAYM